MYTVTIENEPEFRREWHRAEEVIGLGTVQGVDLGCREGAAEALRTKHWKDRTGETSRKTRGFLEFRTTGGALGVIECAVPHASYLEEGTVAHEIYPKAVRGTPKKDRKPGQSVRAKDDIGTTRVMLRWYDNSGNPVFRASVSHPGTKPDGFMGRGVQKCERVVIREVELGVVRAQNILDA